MTSPYHQPPHDDRNPYQPPRPQQEHEYEHQDVGEEVISTVIPYRNQSALIGYYLGVFSVLSCVPFLGVIFMLMSGAAVWQGIRGLQYVGEHPQAKGTAHAMVGILAGSISFLAGLLVHGAIFLGIVGALARS
ncbi:MAG: hypothetical protein N2C14_17460 [Planctomycetales bacterium]